jgi:hypothetical protein
MLRFGYSPVKPVFKIFFNALLRIVVPLHAGYRTGNTLFKPDVNLEAIENFIRLALAAALSACFGIT